MTGQEIFRARDGKLAEVWHQEDVPGMLRQLGLEPPPAIMRLAARLSARRYRRQQHATKWGSARNPGGSRRPEARRGYALAGSLTPNPVAASLSRTWPGACSAVTLAALSSSSWARTAA
jgi:hypothetical protein